MAEHRKCIAEGCGEPVEPPRAFCRSHRDALPKRIRSAIWESHLKRKPNESAGYVNQARQFLGKALAGQV
jgi:hypothetical protein